MSIRAYRDIHRRKSRKIRVGKVEVGGDAPITVQSMTNTVTSDARATIEQVRALEVAGADIVRLELRDRDARGHRSPARVSATGRCIGPCAQLPRAAP